MWCVYTTFVCWDSTPNQPPSSSYYTWPKVWENQYIPEKIIRAYVKMVGINTSTALPSASKNQSKNGKTLGLSYSYKHKNVIGIGLIALWGAVWSTTSTVTSDCRIQGDLWQRFHAIWSLGIDPRKILGLIYLSDQFCGLWLPQSCHLRSPQIQASEVTMLTVKSFETQKIPLGV